MQSGSLGYFLQGVSQQAERVQPDGHVRAQLNFLPDPNRGLTTRPGTDKVFDVDANEEKTSFHTSVLDNELYAILCSDNNLRVLAYDGTEYEVLESEEGDLDYIGPAATIHAVDGEFLVVNNEVVVEEGAASSTGFIDNWGFALHLGGQFAKTYSITITYADNTTTTASYTAPDGDVAGDADKVNANFIMQELLTQLNTSKKASTTITRASEVLAITDNATTFRITVEDGAGGSIMRSGVGSVKTFADIPRFAPEGAVLRVTGEAGTTTDDVWLRFTVLPTALALGQGFGSEGVWREFVDPSSMFEYDLSTMPHVISIDKSTQTATLSKAAWRGRQVGTENTNPAPSFVGRRIKDITVFAGRLWFLAGNAVVTTRTFEYLDTFRQSALQIVDTDPIDVSASGETTADLEFAVSFDRNLLLFTNKSQFIVTGGSALTPSNVAILRSTNFEASLRTRPNATGNVIFMPYSNRTFSGINEISPSEQVEQNLVGDTNKVTKRYIAGEAIEMASSANHGMLVVRTDADLRTIYVHNFMWQDQTKIQAAWHKWSFPDPVVHVYMDVGRLYMWSVYNNKYHLSLLLPDKPDDLGLPYHSSLDYKTYRTGYMFDLDRPDYLFTAVAASDYYAVGQQVTPTSVAQVNTTTWRYTLPEEVEVLAGVLFIGSMTPNRPMASDWRGSKKPSARVVTSKYVVDYENSGTIQAYMDNVYRDTEFVIDNSEFPMDEDPNTGFDKPLRSGSFDVPWGDDNFVSGIEIRTVDPRPVTITEIRWYGQVFNGRK